MTRFLLVWLAALALRPAPSLAQTPPPAGFERTPSGIEYRLFRRDAGGHYQPRPLSVPGDSAYDSRIGRYLLMHIVYLTGRDSVLESTRRKYRNRPTPTPLQPLAHPGMPDEAISLMLPGDSAVFRFSADSLYRSPGRQVPGFLQRSGNVVVMQVAARRLLNAKAAIAVQQKLQQVTMARQQRQLTAYITAHRPQENAKIQAYLKRKKLTAGAHKTPGGTWYVITKRGAGPLPKTDQLVSVRYRGRLLATDKEFDTLSVSR